MVFLQSCHNGDCSGKLQPDIHRRKFTEDEKKWILISDSSLLYKYYNNGKIDTVNGIYEIDTRFIENSLPFNCYILNFSEINSKLMFPSLFNSNNFLSYDMSNQYVDNYEIIFQLGEPIRYNYDYKTDTALINGKIYDNVIKCYREKDTVYLAKGTGWIYIKHKGRKFELIPK